MKTNRKESIKKYYERRLKETGLDKLVFMDPPTFLYKKDVEKMIQGIIANIK